MALEKCFFHLWDEKEWERFDLCNSGARSVTWREERALYLEKINAAIFLQEIIPFRSFRMQAEVAIPETVGFIGLVFGAKNPTNYELVYLAPFELQYDPVMNGSMTWQIYNGPNYQKPLQDTRGTWHTLTLEVHPNRATVFLNNSIEPQLSINNLQHGNSAGRVGVWNYLPSYIRNLKIEEITIDTINSDEIDFHVLKKATYVTDWLVSQPYKTDKPDDWTWTPAKVEENGTLNINRLYPAEVGSKVSVVSSFLLMEVKESILSLGFSDSIRLWINEEEIFHGDWLWAPPKSDGRIRTSFKELPIKWRKGENTIRAEITHTEFFGWGLVMKTGLPVE